MLEYQKQDCELTLREGLECYYQSFPESKEILKDSPESGYLLRDHDCTHVIFGLDISIDQEAILDTWVLWGTSYKLSYLNQYRKLPQLKEFNKNLIKELRVRGILKLLSSVLRNKIIVFKRTRKMKKKWPFKHPEAYLERSIFELRNEYGIDILNKEERTPKKKLTWSGSF